jgi:hypothetical protein
LLLKFSGSTNYCMLQVISICPLLVNVPIGFILLIIRCCFLGKLFSYYNPQEIHLSCLPVNPFFPQLPNWPKVGKESGSQRVKVNELFWRILKLRLTLLGTRLSCVKFNRNRWLRKWVITAFDNKQHSYLNLLQQSSFYLSTVKYLKPNFLR